MIYDFETLVSRKNTGSGKWDEMTKEHPNLPENVAPLSVADMELKNPPEIVEGLKKYIDTHILGYTGPTEEYFDAVCGWMKRRNGSGCFGSGLYRSRRRRYHHAAGLLSV